MKTLLKYSILIWLAMLSYSTAQAQEAHTYALPLQKAQQLYNAQKYDSAALIYQQIVDEDKMEAFELYYNLGNAYFKLNEIPSAILYYEKAKKIAPQNQDLAYNLALCNRMIPDKIETVPQLFFIKWYRAAYNALSVDSWAYLSLFIFVISLLLLAIVFMATSLRWRRLAFALSIIFIGLTLLSVGITHQKYKAFVQHKEAIVFSPSLTVKSQPSDSSVDIFVIHEGTKVQVLDEVGEWRKIKIQNGSIGWVLVKELERI